MLAVRSILGWLPAVASLRSLRWRRLNSPPPPTAIAWPTSTRAIPITSPASFPKLITPQWVGEDGVEAVVVLAIDDMRGHEK